MQDLLSGPNRNAGRDRPKITEFFGKAEGGIKKSLGPPDNFFVSLLCASDHGSMKPTGTLVAFRNLFGASDLLPNQTDKCVLTIAQPKRLRDKRILSSLRLRLVLSVGDNLAIRIIFGLLSQKL